MAIENRKSGSSVWGKRYRCDACKKLVKPNFSPFVVLDGNEEKHLCSKSCLRAYWQKYQMAIEVTNGNS